MNDRRDQEWPAALGFSVDDPPPDGPEDAARLHQDILNGLPIPRRSLQHDCWIPVTARLVWEDDGLELRDTIAYAWFGRKVLVEVRDRRHQTNGTWLHVSDVRRLSAQQ